MGIGTAAAVVFGTAAVGTAACVAGALTLYNKVIPRQDVLRVNLDEVADMKKWEEYKKMIAPRAEWLSEQKLEHITIKSRDGLTLHGNYFPAEGESKGIVLCNHGYTSNGMQDCCSISYYYHGKGYDCLLVDHRGHGQSEGKYIGFGILDRYDCLEWIKYVDKRFEGKKDIILHGISMGATTVLMTAGFPDLPESVKAVISDCAFTSPYDVFAHILKRDYHLPPFPIMNINDAICRKTAGYGFKDYSTLDAVKVTKLPILFIHGKDDDFVPTWMTEKNYEQCTSPKDILWVPNAAHGASYYESPEMYEEKITEFLEKYLPRK
ncbi:MAG: alpha/beta hydrolase [Huintestinicola sp.]